MKDELRMHFHIPNSLYSELTRRTFYLIPSDTVYKLSKMSLHCQKEGKPTEFKRISGFHVISIIPFEIYVYITYYILIFYMHIYLFLGIQYLNCIDQYRILHSLIVVSQKHPVFYNCTFINSTRCSEDDQMCCCLTYEIKCNVCKHTVIHK